MSIKMSLLFFGIISFCLAQVYVTQIDSLTSRNTSLLQIEPEIHVMLSDSTIQLCNEGICQDALPLDFGDLEVEGLENEYRVCLNDTWASVEKGIRRRLQYQHCHTWCWDWDTTANRPYRHCPSCYNGGYKQPTAKSCLDTCPSGYSASGGLCNDVGGKTATFTFVHDRTENWTDGSYQITGSNTTPAKNRGMYFNGSNSYQALSYFTLDSNFVVLMWIYPTNQVLRTMFYANGQSETNDREAALKISSSRVLKVRLNEDSKSGYTGVQENVWTQIGMKAYWIDDSSDWGYYESWSYLNGSQDRYNSSHGNYPFHMRSPDPVIGMRTSDQFFQGFIYKIIISNDTGTSASTEYSQNVTGSAWSCLISQYWNGSSYQYCPSSCQSTGCASNTCTTLCHDWECVNAHCPTFASSSDCNSCGVSSYTTGGTKSGGASWDCAEGYGRTNVDSQLCTWCFTRCASCGHGGYNHYQYCTSCTSGNHDTAPSGASYAFCSPEAATSVGNEVIRFVFDKPYNQFTATGAVGGTYSVTTEDPSGWPVKYRGIYLYRPNRAYVTLPSFTLYHTFTLTAWIYPMWSGNNRTIFSKDRNSGTGTARYHLWFYLNTSDQLEVYMVKDQQSGQDTGSVAHGSFPINTWAYALASVEMTNGSLSTCTIYKNTVSQGSSSWSNDIFMIDYSSWSSYLFGARLNSDTNPTTNKYGGYIYEFGIYNKSSTGGGTYSSANCNGTCWTGDYNTYNNGSSCDSGCVNSCVRSEACQSLCSGWVCHLCFDRECTNCWNGYEEYECEEAGGAYAQLTGAAPNNVECISNYGRRSTNYICEQCHLLCESCDYGNLSYYSDCTECMAGAIDIGVYGSYKFCVPDCPTNFGGNSNCVIPSSGDRMILSYDFMYHLDLTFTSTGDVTDIDAVVTTSGSAGLPVAYRGFAFNGSENGYIKIETLCLNHSFSVVTWIYPLSYWSSNITIFSKDRDDWPSNYQHIQVYIDTNGRPVVKSAKDENSSWIDTKTSSMTISTNTWCYFAAGFNLVSHTYSSVTFRCNGTTDTVSTSYGYFMRDDPSWPFYIGTKRTAASTYTERFNGFIYDWHVFQQSYTSYTKYTSSCNGETHASSCSTCGLSGYCNWAVSFTQYRHYGSTQNCNSSCNSVGCRRAMACRSSCASTYCDHCYDYHCNECLNQHQSQCNSGQCQTTWTEYNNSSNPQDDCNCIEDFKMELYERVDKLYPCCAHGCTYCMLPQHFSSCITCSSGKYQQPLNSGSYKICYDDCPTGYTKNTSNYTCSGSAQFLIDWDLTYITRPIINLQTSWSIFNAIEAPTGYGIVVPYALRGSYFDASLNSCLKIENLRLNHSFSVEVWAMWYDTSGTHTIFSKTKNDYSATDNENLVTVYQADGKMGASIAGTNPNNHWLNHEQSSLALSLATWYHCAFVFSFDGMHTDLRLHKNSNLQVTWEFTDYYVEDKDIYTDAWVGADAQSSGGIATPENPMTGFFYTFRFWNYVRSTGQIGGDVSQHSLGEWEGTCDWCPNQVSMKGGVAWQVNQCLWNAPRDKVTNADDTETDCDRYGIGVACTIDEGCQRREDCNKCEDRRCLTCTNFDLGFCLTNQCIANASMDSLGICRCNGDFYFDEDEDTCLSCDSRCYYCQSKYYKECNECNSGYYMQAQAQTCIDFCPTAHTYDTAKNRCIEDVAGNIVYHLRLDTWDQDFRKFADIINTSAEIWLGKQTSYGSDDPWLDREGSKFSVQFEGAQLLVLRPVGGDSVPLLHHSFSLGAWIFPKSVTGEQVLLSKIDTGETAGNHIVFQFGLNAKNLEVSFTEVDLVADPDNYTVSTVATTTDPIDTASGEAWFYVVVTFAYSSGSTVVQLFVNSTSIQNTSVSQQYTDEKTSENYIGCTFTDPNTSSMSNAAKYYTGLIFEMRFVNSTTSSAIIQLLYNEGLSAKPDDPKCASNEYWDSTGTRCEACGWSCTEGTSKCVVDHNDCSVCNSALCDQCTDGADLRCTSCKSGASLTQGPPGNCACNAGTYDTGLGSCLSCHGDCATCTNDQYYHCQSCTNSKYLHPSTYSCLTTCPTRYSASGNSCSGSAGVVVTYTFDQITKVWNDTTNGVLFNAGPTTADEVEDALPYKLRGLYFDSSQYLKLDVSSGLVLANFLTIQAWIRPDTVTGSLFSKSYSDFSVVGNEDFFDLYLDGTSVKVSITQESTTALANLQIAVAIELWQHVAVVINYDKDNVITKITGYKGGELLSNEYDLSLIIADNASSNGAIGARWDADGAGSATAANFYHGFIYSFSIQDQVLNASTITSNWISTSCTGCISCPSGISPNCLWDCDDHEYYDGSGCEDCNAACVVSLPGTIWAGCVRGNNDCGLCDDPECTSCDSFDSGATCNSCLADASNLGNCTCAGGKVYNAVDNVWDGCDVSCDTCSGTTSFECSYCAANYYLWTDSTFCYNFCPTGFQVSVRDCLLQVQKVLDLPFDQVDTPVANTATTITNPAFLTPSTDAEKTIPVKDRGHWFPGVQYLEIDRSNPANALYLYHSFTIMVWCSIHFPTITRPMTLFSHSKATSSVINEENMVRFRVDNNQQLEMVVEDGETMMAYAKASTTIVDQVWNQLTAKVDYNNNSDKNSVITLYINESTTTITSDNNSWFIEYYNSKSVIGAEYDHDTSQTLQDSIFAGFMYDLKLYNQPLTSMITDGVRTSGCASSNVSCTYWPEETDVCIPTCTVGQWLNGSTCTACDTSCTTYGVTNWVRAGTGVNCTLCDNHMCTSCLKFLSGTSASCQSCVTNAIYSTGTCACDSQHAFQASDYSWTCSSECNYCTALDQYHCSACNSGWFLAQGSGATWCLTYCPTGYDEDSSGHTCVANPGDTRTSYTFNYIITSHATATPNEYPRPAKDRGWYFDGADYLPHALDTHVVHDFILKQNGTIDAYIRPTDVSTDRVIYSRQKPDNSSTDSENHFKFYIDTSRLLKTAYTNGASNILTTTAPGGNALTLGNWVYVETTWYYHSSYTQFKIKINHSTVVTQNTGSWVFLEDSKTYTSLIGVEENSVASAATKANYFQGFMYSIGIANYLASNTGISTTSCGSSSNYGGCSHCPASVGYCLSSCDFLQFPTAGRADAVCTACHGNCTDGCVRTDHCSLCEDRECEICNNFEVAPTSTCSQWFATKTTLSGVDCICANTDEHYYSDVQNECFKCHAHCTACPNGLFSRQSLYDCTTCDAGNGYRMHESICESYCPTTWTDDGTNCVSSDATPQIFQLGDFLTFVNDYTDSISSLPATLGISSQFYPGRDGDDPMNQRYGGLYFDGNDYMAISPYPSQSASIALNYNHAMHLILRSTDTASTLGAAQYLVTRSDSSGVDPRYELYIATNRVVTLSMYMQDVLKDGTPATQAVTFSALPANTNWFTLYLLADISGDATAMRHQFSLYLDGVLSAQQSVSDFYYRDDSLNRFAFGGKYSTGTLAGSYVGNMYEFKIWNYARAVDAADQISSSGCTMAQCAYSNANLAPCLFSQYWDSGIGACGECIGCSDGCVRGTNCVLNEDLLCLTFIDFDSCLTCIDLAEKDSTTNLCNCIANASYITHNLAWECDYQYLYQEDQCKYCRRYVQHSEIVIAAFDDTYEQLVIEFSVVVRTDHHTSWSDFIATSTVEKLGTGPTCRWSGGTKVYITLGYNPSILNEVFEFIPSELYTSEESCSYVQSILSPTLVYPSTQPVPTAAFSLPGQVFPSCTGLILTATSTRGNLRRDLEYRWFLSNANNDYQGLEIGTWSTLWKSYQIVAENLVAGPVTVTLEVKNFIAQVSTASQEVEIVATSGLEVKFTTTVDFNLYKSTFREYPIYVTNNCSSTVGNYAYTWTLEDGPTTLNANLYQMEEKLVIVPGTFTVYGTYSFKATARTADSSLTGFDLLTLTVLAPDLELRVSTPNSSVSVNNELILDASQSYDPDDTTGILTFVWTCTTSSGTACTTFGGVNFRTIWTETYGKRTIPAQSLQQGEIYTFTVTISKDTRTASKSVQITGLTGDTPTLSVKDFPTRVAAHKAVRLEMQQQATAATTLSWSQTFGSAVTGSAYLTPLNLLYLVIAENALTQGGQYTYQLTANYEIGQATAQISFTVNQGPSQGTFTTSKLEGVAFVDQFTLTASDWVDPEGDDFLDYPLLYSFSYINESEIEISLRKPLTENTYTTTLPDFNSQGGNMQLVLHVLDQFETPATATLNVYIYLPTTEEGNTALQTAIANAPSIPVDDIPQYINVYGKWDTLETTQLDTLTDTLERWVSSIEYPTEGTTSATINAIGTLASAPNSSEEITDILKLVDSALADANSIGGISAAQASELISAVNGLATDAGLIDSAITKIGQSAVRSSLPEEPDVETITNDLSSKFRCTTPSRLENSEFTITGKSSSVQLPAGLLGTTTYSDTDEQTVLNVGFKIYPRHESPRGGKSSVVDFTIYDAGTYTDAEQQWREEPAEMVISDANVNITVIIDVEDMPDDFTPDCVAATPDENGAVAYWSTSGCHLKEVRPVEKTVICLCNHLSRFTANEELQLEPTPEPTVEIVEPVVTEDDDASFEIFPVMTLPCGFLIFIVVSGYLHDHCKSKRKYSQTHPKNSSTVLVEPITGVLLDDESKVVELRQADDEDIFDSVHIVERTAPPSKISAAFMKSVSVATKYAINENENTNEPAKVTDLTAEPAVTRSPARKGTFGSLTGALSSAFAKSFKEVAHLQNIDEPDQPKILQAGIEDPVSRLTYTEPEETMESPPPPRAAEPKKSISGAFASRLSAVIAKQASEPPKPPTAPKEPPKNSIARSFVSSLARAVTQAPEESKKQEPAQAPRIQMHPWEKPNAQPAKVTKKDSHTFQTSPEPPSTQAQSALSHYPPTQPASQLSHYDPLENPKQTKKWSNEKIQSPDRLKTTSVADKKKVDKLIKLNKKTDPAKIALSSPKSAGDILLEGDGQPSSYRNKALDITHDWDGAVPDSCRIGSDDSSSTMLQSQQAEPRKLIYSHLLFGSCSNFPPSSASRSLLLCGNLALQIALTGLGYWMTRDITSTIYLEVSWDDTDVNEDFEGDWDTSEVNIEREASLASAAVLITMFISIALVMIHSRAPKVGQIISWIVILVSLGITVYLSLIFNTIWSMTWLACWVFCVAFEMVFSQTFIMFIVALFYYKKGPKVHK